MIKSLRLYASLLLLSVLSACQFIGPGSGFRSDPALERRILGEHTEVPDLDILQIDQAVIDYLDTHIDPSLSGWDLVDRLQALLFSEEFLNIQYDDVANLTAAETFAERRANCLSLVNLYIGMARHLGLSVQYQTIQVRPVWNRRGELMIMSEHINALGRLGPTNQYIVDFTPEVRLQHQTARLVTDEQAKALFYNNLAVEHLVLGELDEAVADFRVALAINPGLAIAWNNMGSVFSRMGEIDLAEYSLLKALSLDRNNASAANNLARYYFETGELDKAERYRKAVESYNRRNPYYHYMLGNLAYEDEDFELALGHFQEALRRGVNEPDFYLALGLTFRQLGDETAYTELAQMSVAVRELGDQTYRASQNRVRRIETRSSVRLTGSGSSIRVID